MTTSGGAETRWSWRRFDQLEVADLYAFLALRDAVFVVEQRCVYQEADGLDPSCHHLLGWRGSRLVAYLRLLPEGVYAPGVVSLGRIAVAADLRGTGLGHALVERGLAHLRETGNRYPVRIKAQSRLVAYYRRFGFDPMGDEFDEDGILHQEMILRPACPA
jgi:ElaA protein